MVNHIEDKNFEQEVLKNQGVVLVDFWATWCGPCKMIAPVIEELSEEMANVTFTKVDVDQNPGTATQYQIASIPTLKIFKNGEVVETLVGFRPKAEIKATLEKHL